MLHHLFIALTWLIGVIGITGAIALIVGVCLLGPAAVTAIVGPVLAKFLACAWCVAAVVFVLATVGAYWVGHHGEYRRGYNAALSAIAAEDAGAIAAATAQRNVWRDCRNRNGQWDQTTGTCQ